MSNIQLNLSYQEKVLQRIREQLGDLLTDEDLKKLVEAAVKDTFFTKRETKDSYGSLRESKPPIIIELLNELLADQVKQQVSVWLKENPEAVTNAIKEVTANGIGIMLLKVLESSIQGQLDSFRCNLLSQLQNGRLY